MSSDKALSWSFCEQFVPEGDVLQATRRQAQELGCTPVSPAVGATLRMLAASLGAKAVTEIGTGVGVSGLWLMSGMSADSVLTTIDMDAEFHRVARAAFAAANYRPPRTRLITGRALDILPRMASRSYDMVFIDAGVTHIENYVEEAARMLRPGGVLAIAHALWFDEVADPARRETPTVTMRTLLRNLSESPLFLTQVLPVGDGLAVCVRL